MPNIRLETNVVIEDTTKISSLLAHLVTVIPGKKENRTMVAVEGGLAMFFEGSTEPCATVHLNVKAPAASTDYDAFSEAVAAMLHQELGVPETRVYVLFHQADYWYSKH